MAIKFNPIKSKHTVAELAQRLSNKGEKVNLQKIAEGRNMMVSSLRTAEGSTIKLLENNNEVDVVVMKHGKVLTAKGKFVADREAADDLAEKAMSKIANYATEGEDLHLDFWA